MADKTPGKYRFRKPDATTSADKRVKSAFTSVQSKKRSLDESHDKDTGTKSSRVSSSTSKDALTGNTVKNTSNEKRVHQKPLLSFADEEEDG
jgi:vacuolar-type H+-ATPase subunit H